MSTRTTRLPKRSSRRSAKRTEVLSDKEKRAKYDQFGQYWEQAGAPGQGGPGAQQWQDFNFDFGGFGGERVDIGGESGFSDFFEMLFGGGRHARGGAPTGPRRTVHVPQKGRNIESELEISLEDAFNGAKKVFGISGRTIELTIPKGVKDGQKLRLANQGEEGHSGSGDLLVQVKIRPHPVFERKDDDLYTEVPVDYVVAALGGELQVPTLTGRVTMRSRQALPAAERSDCRGRGCPR